MDSPRFRRRGGSVLVTSPGLRLFPASFEVRGCSWLQRDRDRRSFLIPSYPALIKLAGIGLALGPAAFGCLLS